MEKIVVIGSGLSAVGAIKALISQGIVPTVIDKGLDMDPQTQNLIQNLSLKLPSQWSKLERNSIGINPSAEKTDGIPKKMVFGSDYFYGKSTSEFPISSVGNPPPFSYALGGLSAGWGAAVLPPKKQDITDWPIDYDRLLGFCSEVLKNAPYSAVDDGLSLSFPLLKKDANPIRLSYAQNWFLGRLEGADLLKRDKLVFGQARLMVNGDKNTSSSGCKYCGQCMSGCVYGSIYKASDDIKSWAQEGKIIYRSGMIVKKLTEHESRVELLIEKDGGGETKEEFDKVFLAAGAVNSTRIMIESLGLYNQKFELKTRGGFVLPLFSIRKIKLSWPDCNTQPGIFLEFTDPAIGNWVHVQISLENELVLQRIQGKAKSSFFKRKISQFISEHLIIAFVNYHSDHAGHYELSLQKDGTNSAINSLISRHVTKLPSIRVMLSTAKILLNIFLRVGCLPLFPFAKINAGAYHVGGTMPMKLNPMPDQLETDQLGRPSGWYRTHIVDTAIFPSLPGTTVGLVAMANAYRIAEESTRFKHDSF